MKKVQQNTLSSKSLHLEMLQLLKTLRSPTGGCPWDKEQSHQSLKQHLLEECYEVLENLDPLRPELLKEELGDLLFQIYFHAQIASEEGHFCFDDILIHLLQKMKRRHPHVFLETASNTNSLDPSATIEIEQQWEKIKAEEKKLNGTLNPGCLEDIPKFLPALQKAYKMGKKAAQLGFDWTHTEQVLQKVDEELLEFKEALQKNDPDAIREELGDVLFILSNLSRHLHLNPEEVLQQANQKFKKRFQFVENKLSTIDKKLINSELLEQLWAQAKKSTTSV